MMALRQHPNVSNSVLGDLNNSLFKIGSVRALKFPKSAVLEGKQPFTTAYPDNSFAVLKQGRHILIKLALGGQDGVMAALDDIDDASVRNPQRPVVQSKNRKNLGIRQSLPLGVADDGCVAEHINSAIRHHPDVSFMVFVDKMDFPS